MNFNDDILIKWNNNRLINPMTNRKIKENGPTYFKLLKKFNEIEKKKKLSFKNIKLLKKIQLRYRKKFLEKISGPGYKNPLLCTNNRDVITLDNIWIEKNDKKILNLEFNIIYLFTFKIDNLIYGLNIKSLEKLIKTKNLINPFTNKKLDNQIINNAKKKINFINKIVKKEKTNNLSYQQIINNKILNILKILEKNNIYLNLEWIKELNKNSYYKLYNELCSIFNSYKTQYRDIYNKMIKKNYFNYDINYLRNLSILHLKGLILDIILLILSEKKEDNIQQITCYIVLASFCYVSKHIKSAYPDLLIF